MSRAFLIVVVVLLALLAVGVVVLGAFPPKPHQVPVEHVLQNDHLPGS